MPPPIRILIAEASASQRRMIEAAAGAQEDLQVSAIAEDGREAVKQFRRSPVDIVILNVSLSVLDCPQTVKEIRALDANVPILVFSTANVRGGEITLKALSAGASDFISKPANAAGGSLLEYLENQLFAAVRKWHGRAALRGINSNALDRLKSRFSNAVKLDAQSTGPQEVVTTSSGPQATPAPHAKMALRFPELIVIGSSTGGPNALCSVLSGIRQPLSVPMLIVQHMPPRFTRFLAERLCAKSPFQVREAEHGDVVDSQTVLVAPGGVHMELTRIGGRLVVELNEKPPVNSCRPAVDLLFNSAAQFVGARTLAVVLTGMGADGRNGCQKIKQAGGQVIVQDRDSCVVWGMPRSVEEAGLADVVSPLEQISEHLQKSTRSTTTAVPGKLVPNA